MEWEHSMNTTLCSVSTTCDKSVDQQFMAIPGCYVQRGVSILIFTVNHSSTLDDGLRSGESAVEGSHM